VDVPFDIPSSVTLESDVGPGAWIAERLVPHRDDVGVLVGEIVSNGFDAYARVFHPARRRDGTPIRWRELAERYGTTIHPQMQFAHLVGTRNIEGLDDIEPPFEGYVPPEETAWLADALAPYTATATTCWFAVWDGYGSLGGMGRLAWRPGGSEADLRRRAPEERARAKRQQREVATIPRMSFPSRDYFLFRGPLEAAHISCSVTRGSSRRTSGGPTTGRGASRRSSTAIPRTSVAPRRASRRSSATTGSRRSPRRSITGSMRGATR
jgi:hypothetical protein